MTWGCEAGARHEQHTSSAVWREAKGDVAETNLLWRGRRLMTQQCTVKLGGLKQRWGWCLERQAITWNSWLCFQFQPPANARREAASAGAGCWILVNHVEDPVPGFRYSVEHASVFVFFLTSEKEQRVYFPLTTLAISRMVTIRWQLGPESSRSSFS